MTISSAREQTTRLAELLRRERSAVADFILALSDFDRDRSWERLGYPGLFPFLVRELGLSKGAAYYRKTAAELVQRHPDVLAALREGKLCLMSIVELSKVLAPGNEAQVLPRFFHLSKREAQEVAAALLPQPAPPLRTVVTTPAPDRELAPAPALVTAPGDASPLEVFRKTSSMPTSPVSVGASVSPRAQPTQVEPLTADLRRVHITVSRRLLDKLAAAKDALSHAKPGATDDEILEAGLDLLLERQAKRRGLVKKPREATATAAEATASAPSGSSSRGEARPRSRYVPAAVRRAVWERDRGCCQWKIDGGGTCGSTLRVEIDHVEGWARGAGSTVDELRLLCRVHQVESARRLYGTAVMDRYRRPKGDRCSEPVAEYSGGLRSSALPPSTACAGEPGHAESVPPRGAASARATHSMLPRPPPFRSRRLGGTGRRLRGQGPPCEKPRRHCRGGSPRCDESSARG